MKKTLIILPTLNEARNIQKLYILINNLKLNLTYLFIDHGSSDGTQEIIKRIKKQNPNKNFIIQKKIREGIGKAHKDGLNWAYKKKYKLAITMDTDFAHHPRYILNLLNKVKNSDLIVGSRYLKKNSAPDWSLFRKFLSNGAHLATFILFGINFDTTNSFRCYNLSNINPSFLKKCTSNDYDFFFTSIAILNLRDYKISQIPMKIKSRVEGNSKMFLIHMLKSIINMFILFFKIKFRIIK
tara:strand:- start:1981 stop:2700 length:720 start_codon:yes stop_codon:yes gene_type:complete